VHGQLRRYDVRKQSLNGNNFSAQSWTAANGVCVLTLLRRVKVLRLFDARDLHDDIAMGAPGCVRLSKMGGYTHPSPQIKRSPPYRPLLVHDIFSRVEITSAPSFSSSQLHVVTINQKRTRKESRISSQISRPGQDDTRGPEQHFKRILLPLRSRELLHHWHAQLFLR